MSAEEHEETDLHPVSKIVWVGVQDSGTYTVVEAFMDEDAAGRWASDPTSSTTPYRRVYPVERLDVGPPMVGKRYDKPYYLEQAQ